MPPKPTGQVIERETRDGRVFALRFRAYGERQYLSLGSTADGWSRERAERELRHALADVERGIWIPPVEAPAAAPPDPGFHAFASEWLAAREGELRATTIADYAWQLSNHLLPVLPPPPAVADHRRRGRPLPRAQGPRGRAVGRVDQQDDHPARADTRRRRRARPDRAQPPFASTRAIASSRPAACAPCAPRATGPTRASA